MRRSTIVSIILGLFISTPLWLYLLHFVLINANAGRLEMFLFWIYVPVNLLLVPALAISAEGIAK